MVGRADLPEPDALEIMTSINGAVVARRSLRRLVRPFAALISAVSQFITLRAGDVLAAGVAYGAPRARAGDSIEIDVPGIGRLSHTLAAAS